MQGIGFYHGEEAYRKQVSDVRGKENIFQTAKVLRTY